MVAMDSDSVDDRILFGWPCHWRGGSFALESSGCRSHRGGQPAFAQYSTTSGIVTGGTATVWSVASVVFASAATGEDAFARNDFADLVCCDPFQSAGFGRAPPVKPSVNVQPFIS